MRWPWQRKTTSAELVLGIELHQQQTFAVVRNAHGVIACYRPAVDEQGTVGLEAWLREHQWQHLDTTLSLDPQDYETHLIEAPNVADDELNDAVRFRMKDVLSQPIEQCVLQSFRLADDAYRGRSSMAMVVATRRDWVQQWVHWCEQQSLNLQAITIAELSLLHIVGQLEPETSVGVLRLNGTDSVLYVYQNGSLYLTRKLEVGADALTPMANDGAFELVNDPQFDRLTLELQRSLDYFESQLGVGAIVLRAPTAVPGLPDVGQVEVEYAVPVWLRDDFNNDGTLTSPRAQAQFGVYRGHDRIIYWRERQ